MSAKLVWNYSPSELASRKGINRELHKYLADRVEYYSRDYVPYDTGLLSVNVQTYGAKDHATISYKTPYAEIQYYGDNGSGVPESEWKRNRTFNPLATSFWDKAAWNVYGDKIIREVDKKRKELSKP